MTALEIYSYLDCSMVHIHRFESDKLASAAEYHADNSKAMPALIVYEYTEGFWVHIPLEDDMFKAVREDCHRQLFSDDFLNLMELCHDNKCQFLRLDRDGAEYGIPRFDDEW